ncbi:hypothetical protein [Niabella aquatica]
MKDIFMEILKAFDSNPVDFVFDDQPGFISDSTAEVKSHLVAFGKNKAGCLFCYWKETSEDTEAAPIAWIDSEGSPNAIFARNLRQFFELLSYGTGAIYDIIKACERFTLSMDNNSDPAILFKDLYQQTFDQETDKKRFSILLAKKAGIRTSENPGRDILEVYQKFHAITEKLENTLK